MQSAIEHWVGLEMADARNRWQTSLTKILDSAEQQARAAADDTDDGHVDIAVPPSFTEHYETAVADLGDSSAEARHRVQRRLFVEEAGGKKPTIA